MFKIESYIAPLLMGYVDKYVKLRPEDFQLSLWGGDAVLNNLNLRLDAIEQAINLPICFKSGHIHELHLHVPWTRLGSEPVVITVNTIECIVRLKDSTMDSDKRSSKSESSTRSTPQTLKIKPKKQPVEEELPPGYLQSLVNKVINNVNIIVNNLILKFVEDDIVLSVNVKSAECYSVSPGWNRAFVEVTPAELILRKVINFCDLTVCLDKCDSSGRIEIYQEPLLYRCSLSCRMHLTYQSPHSKLPLITKVNILCEKLDVSLTDLQLPLVVRLIELCLALYYGTLQLPNEDSDSNAEPDSQEVFRQSAVLAEGQEESAISEYDDQGWASWAWSFVPQILPEDYEEDEDEDSLNKPRKKLSPAVLCIGFYIKNASVMLKLTETVREAVHFGPSRVLFRPFIFVEAGGLAVSLVLFGHSFLDVQCGITHICMTSQGPCVCSTVCNENISSLTLLKGGESIDNDGSLCYLTNSLFDIACAENVLQTPSFITDFDKHVEVYTEQYGMQKFGLFWFDYLYTVIEPERKAGSKSSSSSDANSTENVANIRENALLSFLLGSVIVNVSSSFVHRLQKVFYCATDHEYEPYSLPKTELLNDNSPLPTVEQVKHLEEYTPIRTYNITVLEPKIYIFAAEHPQKSIQKHKHQMTRSSRSSAKRSTEMSSTPCSLPAVVVSASRFELQFYQAMYPQHVVRLVSKLAGPSSQLMHNCYTHMQLRLFGLSVGLLNIDKTGKPSHTETIVSPCSGSVYKKSLLFPENWKNPYLPSVEYMVEVPQFSLSIKKAHVHYVFHIWKTWLEKKPNAASSEASDTLFQDMAQYKEHDSSSSSSYKFLPLFELTFGTFEMRCCLTPSANAFTGTLTSIQAVMYVNSGGSGGKGYIIPLISGPSQTTTVTSSSFYSGNAPPSLASLNSVDWLSFTVQLPSKIDTPEAPALLQMNVCGLAIMLDSSIYQWLSYTPKSKVNLKVTHQQRQHQKTTSVTIDPELVQTTSPLQRNLSQASVASSSSTCHPTTVTGPSQSATQTQSASQQPKENIPESEKCEDFSQSDNLGNRLAKHFPLLRIMQLQITLQPWSVFFPTKSMLQSEPNMDIPGNLKDAFNAGLSCDILVVCLPHITVHTSGPRSIFMMQDIPVRSLEGSLLGDKLPWTITVSNYSMYSLHPMKKAFSLVKPGSVSCTVAVSTKYHPPSSDNISSLALCLHLDMHTMKFACSLKQVQLCISILNQLIVEGSKISTLSIPKASSQKATAATEMAAGKPNQKDLTNQQNPSVFSHSHTHAQTYSTSISNDVDVTGFTETSGEFSREATPIRDQEMEDDSYAEGVKLSLWLQWTCPSCEIKFYGTDTVKEEENQIVCLSEELAISIDVQEIYIKAKANIGSVSITQHFRRSDCNNWRKGPYEGIILSCTPDLVSNTQIIGPRLWSLSDNGLQTSTVNLFQSTTDQPREKRHGFLSLTFTRALCKNVKRRLCKLNVELIGLHDIEASSSGENLYFHKYISEVCLSMEPCDVVIYLPAIKSVFDIAELSLLMSSLHKLCRSGVTTLTESEATPKTPSFSFTTSSLPLMYVNLSCLRMFFPNGQSGSDARTPKSMSNATLDHDMLLLQFHLLSLSSQADNPLPRYVVCKHLFAHALQAGITHQPGSAIEDRQYQFDIKGLSLSSGRWQDFVKKTSKSTGFPETVSPTVQIPALEWNTLQYPNQRENVDVILVPLAYNFNLKVVVAPPIVYNRPTNLEQKPQADFLVCGAALEVNVTTELDFFISINQISLLQQVINKNISCFFEIDIPKGSVQQMENADRLGHVFTDSSQVADSGLGSEISTTTNYKGMESLHKTSRHTATSLSCSSLPPKNPLKPSSSISPMLAMTLEMPLEVLLTAGRISCMVYSHQYLQSKEQHGASVSSYPSSTLPSMYHEHVPSLLRSFSVGEQMSAADGIFNKPDEPTSSQIKVSLYIVPYLYLYFSQPHTVVALQPEGQKFEMSFYDVMVKGPSASHKLLVDANKLLPEYADFNQCWIETRAGQPHPKTGVPPSFFTLRLTDFLHKPAHVSLHMERPLKLNISPDMLLLLQELFNQIEQSMKLNSRTYQNKQSTDNANSEVQPPKSQEATFQLLSTLNWIDQFSLTSDQIVISLETKSADVSAGLMASLTAINMDVTLNQCENGVVNEILSNLCLKDVQLKTCYSKQPPLPFLGPTSLNFSTASQQCVHSGPDYLPKTVLTLEMGLLFVHFGQEHVLCLRNFTEQFSQECKPLFTKQSSSKSESKPTVSSTSQDGFVTMNTIDDLRTGKFEYIIDPVITDGHPGPHQILFCNCDNNGNSSMTWCYDQSRVLSHVTISPVPFSLVDESSILDQQPSRIPCTLQYWDSLVNQFFAYQNFTLSENESSTLPLPEVRAVNGPELMAAQMWRVVIHQKYTACHSHSSTSSGVDDFDGSYPCVLPASLAACMRVDSCFIPSLVPVVQVLVTMPTLLLKFSNHFNVLGQDVPEKLKPFTFQDNDPSDQEWGVLILESPAVMGSYSGGHTTKTSLQFSCACQLDIVEFRYLTQQTVVKPFSLQGEVTIIPDGECQLISVDCSVDNLMVRVGKGAVHTLHCTTEVWKQFIKPAVLSSSCNKVVFSHYIICNDTYSMICFGQTGTTENLVLKPEEMYCYSWCSQKTPTPMLHVCVNAETWFWCDPFSIDDDGIIVRVVTTNSSNLKLIIKVKALSNVQKQVIIRGQLLFSNRLSLPLEMKVVTNRHRTTYTSTTLEASKNGRSLIYDEREPCVLRLRQSGVPTAWSQEVYICGERMKETRLVKIPILVKNQYIHLWCHIYSQDYGLAIQKLIILSPLFVLKSHLPVPLYIDLETPKLGKLQQIEIPSEGQPFQLSCLGGDIVHSLTFQLGENLQKSTPAMAISTGMIEQVKRAPVANPVNIENLLIDWQKDTSPPKWPYIKIHDKYRDVVPVKESGNYNHAVSVSGSISSKPASSKVDAFSIDVDISLTEYWPGCSTVLLDIVPSYLLTNNTNIPLVVISPYNQQWNVPCGATFTPTGIQEYFQLGLQSYSELFTSGKIPLSDEEVAARRYRTDIGETLYTDGFVHTAIFSDMKAGNKVAYFFTVNSSVHHNIRVITVSERFSLTNLSGTPYQIQMVCVPLGYGKVTLPMEIEQCSVPSHSQSKDADNLSPLLSWTVLLQEKHQGIDFNQKNNFVHYIRLREIDKSNQYQSHELEPTDDSAWSFPLRITSSKTGVRLTTSVPIRASSYATTRPLVISGHTDEGLTYFVAEQDNSPGCLISNCCSFPVTYGQTLMNLSISDVTVVEETEYLDVLPMIAAGKCVYYTMPFINSTFPEMPGSQILPKLHIGVSSQDDVCGTTKARWSSGIDILSHYDTFLRIPNFSDIKVHVERVNMTTYLILEPVSKADISAKEIRSRIKGRETTVLIKDQITSGSKESVKKSSTFSSVMSLQKANMPSSLDLKWDICFSCGCLLKNVCIIILDEMSSSDVIGEILCISLSNFFLAHYPATNFPSQMLQMSKSSSSLCIGDIQIDNQLFHRAQYDFPVILIRQQSPTSSKKTKPTIESHMSAIEKHAILKSDSFLHLQLVLETDVSNSGSFIRALDISVQPLALFVEDAFIYRLFKELQAFIPTPLSSEPQESSSLKHLPRSLLQAAKVHNSPIRMQYLCIHPINTLLSVHASLKLFIASDHSPLSFGKFEKDEIFTSCQHLIRSITMHYASGALFRAGIVVGSLEILGNPTGLVRNIGTGVADLFKLPITGLTQGPGAFLTGVSQGMSSLLRNVTAGTLTSITNFASSVSRNMDRLSLDAGHLERQEENRRIRPTGLSDGLKQGLSGLGISLLGAIAGIADQPIQGVLSSQLLSDNSLASGFVTGVGKGLVGVVTKPIGGAAEFLSQTGQGILHGVGLTQVPKARLKPSLEPVHQGRNSSVKYLFKTLQSVMPVATLLMAVDVVQFDFAGLGSKVVLLLTPELLFVYDCEEDMSLQTFALAEIECPAASNLRGSSSAAAGATAAATSSMEDLEEDSCVLSFVWQDQTKQMSFKDQHPNKDRVTAFLDSTPGFIPLPGLSSDTVDNGAGCSIDSGAGGTVVCDHQSSSIASSPTQSTAAPYFEFRVEPHYRETFLTLFQMAKNRLVGRGFLL